MKKLISLVSIVMLTSCLFAAGSKWKSSDIYHPKKLDKLIETYNLTKTYEKGTTVLYKNEETSDFIYITKDGSEENNDKRVFFESFACLGGVFDSCSIYGGFTDFSKDVRYMYSYINESNTAIQKGDYMGKSTYGWNNPQYIYYLMFIRRLMAFRDMLTIQNELDIEIPEDVLERYDYFSNWLVENNEDEKVFIKISKEYKQYLKDHK